MAIRSLIRGYISRGCGRPFQKGSGEHEMAIEAFPLKDFFMSPEASSAEFSLSPSYAEPMVLSELLALAAPGQNNFEDISLGYPPLHGSAGLRSRIANLYEGFAVDNIVVTNGLDDALGAIGLALASPGDRIIVQTPCYQTHRSVAAWRGVEVCEWPCVEENGWAPDLGYLEDLLKQPTRFVVLCTPHNPTGFTPDLDFRNRLIDLLRTNGTVLIADEIYTGLPNTVPWGEPLACQYENAISLHGLSKTLGLPGLRVGWMATQNLSLLEEIREIKDHFNSFITAPSEYLAALALDHSSEILTRNSNILAGNVAIANAFFQRHGNLFDWTAPVAGVNGFPRWLGPDDAETVSMKLLRERRLLLASSARFNWGKDHFRVGLGCRSLAQAMERLDEYLGDI